MIPMMRTTDQQQQQQQHQAMPMCSQHSQSKHLQHQHMEALMEVMEAAWAALEAVL